MLHLNYGLSDSEQAHAGENTAAALPPGADGADLASAYPAAPDLAANAQPAGSASADGYEETTRGGAGEDWPSSADPNESPPTLAASPTPKQRAFAKAKQDAAARPAAKSRQSTATLSPPPGAAKLRDMLITQRGGALRLSLITGERSTYYMFRLENPNRVVVDVPGTWIALPADRLRGIAGCAIAH